jgi:glucan phosphorylase
MEGHTTSASLFARLSELARNLWWTWQPELIAIFRDLDPALWRATNHSPVAFLVALAPDQLVQRAEETALESRINQAFRRPEEYLGDRRAAAGHGPLRVRPVAYFSAEFALHESDDFNLTRHLVQGADVWLNTPRRPLEACGTSGQKVVLNGGLNCSVLDGWWAEAWDGENGFTIGDEHVHGDPAVQDARDTAALYDVLEREVIPLYYERGPDGVPHGWVARMKHAVATLAHRFNADRMVRDCVEQAYLPAAGATLSAMPGTVRS